MLRISVITPSYNQGAFIKKHIDSVRAQSGVQVEHIILDNCSTDQTSDLLNMYQDDPQGVDVKIIVEPDKGQTAAINRGFLMASGDVVCWLNTDEFYHDGALQNVAQYFAAHPEVDVLFADCDFVDAKGEIIKKRKGFSFSRAMLIYYGCYFPSCSTFIRKRVIDAGHLLDESFRVTMDFEYYTRLATLEYHFEYMPQSLASFTWHETNISSTQVERRLVERRIVQERFSGLGGPAFFRVFMYEFLRYFWVAVRVGRRVLR